MGHYKSVHPGNCCSHLTIKTYPQLPSAVNENIQQYTTIPLLTKTDKTHAKKKYQQTFCTSRTPPLPTFPTKNAIFRQ